MITVINSLTVNKINGNAAPVGSEELQIMNVFNSNSLVEISFMQMSVQVNKSELLKAIENATNNEVR